MAPFYIPHDGGFTRLPTSDRRQLDALLSKFDDVLSFEHKCEINQALSSCQPIAYRGEGLRFVQSLLVTHYNVSATSDVIRLLGRMIGSEGAAAGVSETEDILTASSRKRKRVSDDVSTWARATKRKTKLSSRDRTVTSSVVQPCEDIEGHKSPTLAENAAAQTILIDDDTSTSDNGGHVECIDTGVGSSDVYSSNKEPKLRKKGLTNASSGTWRQANVLAQKRKKNRAMSTRFKDKVRKPSLRFRKKNVRATDFIFSMCDEQAAVDKEGYEMRHGRLDFHSDRSAVDADPDGVSYLSDVDCTTNTSSDRAQPATDMITGDYTLSNGDVIKLLDLRICLVDCLAAGVDGSGRVAGSSSVLGSCLARLRTRIRKPRYSLRSCRLPSPCCKPASPLLKPNEIYHTMTSDEEGCGDVTSEKHTRKRAHSESTKSSHESTNACAIIVTSSNDENDSVTDDVSEDDDGASSHKLENKCIVIDSDQSTELQCAVESLLDCMPGGVAGDVSAADGENQTPCMATGPGEGHATPGEEASSVPAQTDETWFDELDRRLEKMSATAADTPALLVFLRSLFHQILKQVDENTPRWHIGRYKQFVRNANTLLDMFSAQLKSGSTGVREGTVDRSRHDEAASLFSMLIAYKRLLLFLGVYQEWVSIVSQCTTHSDRMMRFRHFLESSHRQLAQLTQSSIPADCRSKLTKRLAELRHFALVFVREMSRHGEALTLFNEVLDAHPECRDMLRSSDLDTDNDPTHLPVSAPRDSSRRGQESPLLALHEPADVTSTREPNDKQVRMNAPLIECDSAPSSQRAEPVECDSTSSDAAGLRRDDGQPC